MDLLAAGAPCQPFSIGGKHKAHSDERKPLPAGVPRTARDAPEGGCDRECEGIASWVAFGSSLSSSNSNWRTLPSFPQTRSTLKGGKRTSPRSVRRTAAVTSRPSATW
ncbi:DNA cytosine methyltransferase [Gemmatimonas sp.]|uniref:DNA cytosine methyltransferase n=1 Tax=Gemmatimonas sp. TaxID=1962908 RepID=UPI003DA68642